MQSDYSIVRQDQFIQATRDSGYKGTDSALSELIDNSIQARATSVSVEFIAVETEANGPGRRPMPRVVEVLIADNGVGMDAETLRRSLRFGDGSRFGDRTGLGRFGMGLPNASVSQCKRLEVFSWRRGSKPLHTYIDIEQISRGEMIEVPIPREAVVPAAYAHLTTSPSGTLVVWKECDRLDHDGKAETLVKSLRASLGRMFRYFLIRDFDLTIDGTRVGPVDPLYLMPQARPDGEQLAMQHGDTLRFEVPIPGKTDLTSTVEVTLALLPEDWQESYRTEKQSKERTLARQIQSTAGYSIVRAEREIDLIRSPYHAKHWTDTWYRVEIRFDPELDEVFGVTHTKQHARIQRGSSIYNQMESAIKANIATLKDMIVARGKAAHRRKKQGPKPAEELIKRIEPRLKPIEGLADKSIREIQGEIADFLKDRISSGASPELAEELDRRLTHFPVIIEFEQLPGAPLYRVRVVGRSIVVMLNTAHAFYERVYRRLEEQAPIAKTGVDLLLMALARSEITGSDDARDWYDAQRQDWSQNLKLFTTQLPEFDADDDSPDSTAK